MMRRESGESLSVVLKPMTDGMYHAFFRAYENDPDLYQDKCDCIPYVYDEERVEAYIRRQRERKRLPFAIMLGDEIIGEVKLYDIIPGESAVMGITLKQRRLKDRGFGTQAERLIVAYAFDQLDLQALYADCIVTNTRSQHVLEKVGFEFLRADDQKKYYRITKER